MLAAEIVRVCTPTPALVLPTLILSPTAKRPVPPEISLCDVVPEFAPATIEIVPVAASE